MAFIKLQQMNGDIICVNLNHVMSIAPCEDGTSLQFDNSPDSYPNLVVRDRFAAVVACLETVRP